MNDNKLQELINFAKDNELMNEEFEFVVDRYNEFINDIDDSYTEDDDIDD